jgi:cytosine/uracil/thiamine/allantoin permease
VMAAATANTMLSPMLTHLLVVMRYVLLAISQTVLCFLSPASQLLALLPRNLCRWHSAASQLAP